MIWKFTLICFALMMMVAARADELTQADKEELRERLKAIQQGTKLMQDKRFKSAMDAFNSAMQSEDAALELYLKCVEQADFIDLQKKGQEFRDWKRDNENRLKSQPFRQALRHQLRWLSLTMRAAARPEEINKLGPEAQEIVRGIVTNAEKLEGQNALLSSPVLGSVFARCFKLTDLPLKQWPSSPMEVAAIYDQLVLPPLRSKAKVGELSAAWDLRIQTESAMAEYFSGGNRRENSEVALVKFRATTLPNLQWSKEIDLFRNGDQRGAAIRMLTHIEGNMNHSKAPNWIEEFQTLVNPEGAVKSPNATAP
jgi:hypothetical protein